MKRNLIFIVLLLAIVSPCRSQYENDCFKLSVGASQKLALNTQTISKDSTLAIDISTPIYGLSISGTSTSPNENSLLRVILKDTHGREYLVYETNSLLSSTSSSSFSNVGIETLSLDGIIPESLQLYVTDGSIMLDKLHYTTTPPALKERSATALSASEIRLSQTEAIVEQMNENLRNQNKMWRAGVTDIALMSYEEKKTLWGNTVPNLRGLEYYKEGVFNLSDILLRSDDTLRGESSLMSETIVPKLTSANSLYVDEFDWGNRHGKNWITPARNQDGQTCWAFAPVAQVEAYINLYFNQLLNYDLSENDIIACYDSTYNPQNGGNTINAYKHMRNNGIVDQESLPNDLSLSCEDKSLNPKDIITIGNYYTDYTYYNRTTLPPDDIMKKKIINSPVLFRAGAPQYASGHVFILTGFKDIEVGDIIKFDPIAWGGDSVIIETDNELCGRTAFHFKNSWGENWGYNGFGYFIVDDLHLIYFTDIDKVIYSEIYTDEDIVCEDADGDGYFWWGIGQKPPIIPLWAQEEPDGDDSNPLYGPMDEYGHLETITIAPQDIVISIDTTWNEENYLYNNVRVIDGGILSISADIMKYPNSSITVENGGELIINGGSIIRGNIIVKNNGKMSIIGGGEILLSNFNNFKVEKGGILNQLSGKIKVIN